MAYRYLAYTTEGKVVEGRVDVSTEELAKEALRRSGYRLLSLRAARQRRSFRQSVPTLFGVKAPEVIAFSRQMATLVERGTTPLTALQVLRDQIPNAAFKEVIAAVIQDVQQGSSLSEAISRHPQAFPTIYSRMVKVSEQTGNLESALRQIADYMEREKTVVKRVSRAMIYPVFILLLAVVVVIILITFTLPPLMDMFNDLGTQLPLVTRLLVGFGSFVTGYKLYLAAALVSIVLLVLWYVRMPAGRERLDRLLLRIPLIGPINIFREMAHLSRTMSVLLEAGVSMPETMEVAAQTTRNRVVRQSVEDIRTEILKGHGLSNSIAANGLFPAFLVQMVKVGEQSGSLGAELMAVAESYEREVDERVERFMALLEPTMLVVLGLVVGFIAISVIMPIYTSISTMG